MSFPAYPEYKDSGVAWLGEVPAGWSVVQAKRLFHVIGGSTPKSDEPGYWDGDVPWITPTDLSRLSSVWISDSQRRITEAGLASCGTTLVPSRSVILSTRAPIGSLGIAAVPLCTNQGCKALVPLDYADSMFFAYLLGAAGAELNNRGKGTTFLELSGDALGALEVCSPPASEQSAIVAFLDRETGKIDALVAEQEKLIELLKEKRQAVISHAVTKGIDPNVPMKDSGVEWLGEVPKHWVLSAVGYACGFISYGFTNPMPTSDDGPYMLTANDIGYGKINYSEARTTTADAFVGLTGKSRPKKNDLLLTKDGTLGRVALHDGTEACINQSVALLRPNTEKVEPLFLEKALLGGVYQEKMLFDAGGTTIKHIYITRLAKMALALPSLAEQKAISEHLNDSMGRLDSLITEAQRAIDLLKERRSALISAAVTGKIDVRGLVAQEEAA